MKQTALGPVLWIIKFRTCVRACVCVGFMCATKEDLISLGEV